MTASAACTLDEAGLDLLFRRARTHDRWSERDVTDATLRQVYDLMRWGPTSANGCPARIAFLRTRAARERLRPALLPGNVDKTMSAPVTAIVGMDLRFYERLPLLHPHDPNIRRILESSPVLAEHTARLSAALQGAYLIIAARALGLDCGPLQGFDASAVDREFFSGREIRSLFLCNLGHGDRTHVRPRAARLPFEDACELL
jgi:3-hydroxypropanoate dehydrogenase